MWRKVVCAGCHELIRDRYLLRVHERLWHERCLHCARCREPLTHSCFLRDDTLYCKRDYQRLFRARCRGCSELLCPSELVMPAGNTLFHLHCFCCSVCGCRLQKGQRCVFSGDKLFCVAHYHQQHQDSPSTTDSGKSEDVEEDDNDEDNIKAAGEAILAGDVEHKRAKRPRTILTTQQRRAFKASFEVSSKPCRKVRETLAAETGLSVRVVQVWFQNQRAKMKKLARRQQQQKQTMSPQEKMDGQTQQTAPSSGHAELESVGSFSFSHQNLNLDSQTFKLDPFRQGLTPPRMPGDHMNPYGCDSLTFEDTDIDLLCHFEGSLLSIGSSLLTPIDRLYSMQDSYFAS
ncbi:hypothetical protein DNTS_026557 [Danionella cerebrum]|uniref:LIM homeobox transcription factor 1-alpha n=1 Tax=Danionella cerebrum TaxID=2873325 RepID=A0A553R9P0_9TELE|nr:hypothetical protein DNTS_026557 [Danionella translucida]